MKIREVISHPYTLVTSFFLITISGHSAGSVYFLYLALGVLYGEVYSILGIVGIAVILFSHFKYKGYDQSMDECLINLAGAILLVLSLFLFFYSYAENFNLGAYDQASTFASLLVFGIFTTCFITIIR